MQRNANPLCKERRIAHRNVGKYAIPGASKDVLPLNGTWDVQFDPLFQSNEGLKADVLDFLVRCGVQLSTGSDKKIQFTFDSTLMERPFTLSIDQNLIQISASTLAGAWAGWIQVEREICNRRELALIVGSRTCVPTWSVQISQAPFGSNFLVPDLSPEYLSDDAFCLLAHLGCNGMTIYGDWLLYVNSNILPELSHPEYRQHIQVLQDATKRAAKYGIGLYYVPVSPKLSAGHPVFQAHPGVRGSKLQRGSRQDSGDLHCLCSSNEESLQFFSETWRNLFKEVPLLSGLILIVGGESYYHCFMSAAPPEDPDLIKKRIKTNCNTCGKSTPEQVVSNFVRITTEAVHTSSPQAVILAWPYSAGRWAADPYQIDFIEHLPDQAGFLSEIDKDQWVHRRGYSKSIWDYSIDFTGPSDRVTEQANACKERGTPLFLKTETALGLEFIHVPYVPCLNRLAEKWEHVRALAPAGVLQSWMFFGAFGSRAEELGWWTNWHPHLGREEILRAIATRDFGPAAGSVLEAWKKLSDAIGYVPCIPPYFIGPFFLGPTHPLLPHTDYAVPDVFKGALFYKQEHEASLSEARLTSFDSLVHDVLPESPGAWGFVADDYERAWEIFQSELEQAVQLSNEALQAIKESLKFANTLPFDQKNNLLEEILLVEFMYRTLLTSSNTFSFLSARKQYKTNPGPRPKAKMDTIVRRELVNTQMARDLYLQAPWLDLHLRFEGRFAHSLEMLDEKERILREMLEG